MWCVDHRASQVQPQPLTLPHSVVVPVISAWMMLAVEEESLHYLTVDIADGQVIIAVIGRMQVWSVASRWLGTMRESSFYIPFLLHWKFSKALELLENSL